MLDYQINEAIATSYRKMYGRINEADGPEEAKTGEPRRRNGREKAMDAIRTELALRRGHPSIMASTEDEVRRREQAKLTAADTRAQLRGGNSPSSDPGMRIGTGVYQGLALAAPGMAAGRMAKTAKSAVAAEQAAEKGSLLGRAYGALNKVNLKNAGWKIPAGIAASKYIEKGVDRVADDIESSGHEAEAELVRQAGGWAPFLIAPTGSAARWALGTATDYAQKKIGNEKTANAAMSFNDLIGHQSTFVDGEEGDEGGEESMTDARERCPVCNFVANSHDELLDHCEQVHNM